VAQFQEKSWRISDFGSQVVTGEGVGAIKNLKILRETSRVADMLLGGGFEIDKLTLLKMHKKG
jgi:hypothetical protein